MLKEQQLIEELTWEEVRHKVAEVSKELADIIDNISPGKEFIVFQVSYPFGAKILDKNQFYLPTRHGSSIPINDHSIDSNLKSKLNYTHPPLGIIVKNKTELFYDRHRKIFSLAILGAGLEIGITEHFGWFPPYTITSGARSIYMLPKISETLSHKKLKKRFEITESSPKHLYDQWQVFAQITNSNNFSSSWLCEVIFLSTKWYESIRRKQGPWLQLATYISQKGWEHSEYSRRKAMLDMVWEVFVRSLNNKDLKFNPYVVDTLKHLIYISTSTIPASSPSIGADEVGPLKTIQKIYEEPCGYGLKEYIATMMQPQYFSMSKKLPVYYSLQLPTLLESLPKTKKITSVMDNIRELSELLNCFLNNQHQFWSKLIIGNTPFSNILNNLQIDYFHSDLFAYGDIIKSSLKMPEFDPNLIYDPTTGRKGVFASNSSFLKGCVRITAKS